MKPWRLLAMLVLLAGCAGSGSPGKPVLGRVEGRYTGGHFSVALPVGWVYRRVSDTAVAASRDGFPLQAIVIDRIAAERAFRNTKKAAPANALGSELAELEIAELRSGGANMAALEVLDNEPATVAGTEGFRLTYRHRTSRGLVIQHVVHGFVQAGGYYRLEYLAPALHYFAQTAKDFDATVESLALVAPKPAPK